MEYEKFRRHVGKAGLTINEFAALLEVTPSAISNYAKKGHVPRHYGLLAVLLGHAAENEVDYRALLDRFGYKIVVQTAKVAQLDAYRTERLKGRGDQ